MGRRQRKAYNNPAQNQVTRGNRWFNHYYMYLQSIAYQLFEWKNLPDSIDPRYLELSLHNFGYVAFYKDNNLGYIVTQGAISGQVDHYNLPKEFHSSSVAYNKTFDLYRYKDMGHSDQGVLIGNNDVRMPTINSLEMFAQDLSELKEVIYVNQNAQKTPYIIKATDMNKLSMINVYNQMEDNAPAIFTNENLNTDAITVLQTNAPYVVDKLNTQKNAVWNEVMTYLGIKNTNNEKRERMITDEVNSNNEQITSSANVFLKARKEAVEIINRLHNLEIEVDLRYEYIAGLEKEVL